VKNKHDHTTKSVKVTDPGVNTQQTHEHSSVSKLTPILLLAVLSVHSLFEGLVLGIQESRSDVVAISSAILSHKWVESLSLGLVSIKARASGKFAIFIVALFAFITPLGTLIGYLISSNLQDSVIPVVFNAIALGSFLYIGATEVVGDEFHDVKKKRIRWTKFISLILGATLLCFIRLFIGHEH
jgi:zinc transporter 1/2/3